MKSNFHYIVRCSDDGKRKREEDDKLMRNNSFDGHYFVRCYVHLENCFVTKYNGKCLRISRNGGYLNPLYTENSGTRFLLIVVKKAEHILTSVALTFLSIILINRILGGTKSTDRCVRLIIYKL